jgi:transposase-like protein
MDIFSAPHFRDDEAARKFLEGILWPDGPVCPHCGVIGHSYETKRAGVYRCAEKECRKDFSVTMKTVMERSHIALHKWLQAFHLVTSSKKGVSAHQLHRTLAITYRSAWFMEHRIREAMRAGGLAPIGGGGKTVEVDETFIGRKEGVPKQRTGSAHKNVVLTLVERGGSARSFHIDSTRRADVEGIMRANIRKESSLMTDEGRHYKAIGRAFASHESVDHSAHEYGRGVVHTNTVEGFYSVFKRGMKGIYQHCSEKHLHRYLSEFDFCYSNRSKLGVDDVKRSEKAISGAAGKRLYYQEPREAGF